MPNILQAKRSPRTFTKTLASPLSSSPRSRSSRSRVSIARRILQSLAVLVPALTVMRLAQDYDIVTWPWTWVASTEELLSTLVTTASTATTTTSGAVHFDDNKQPHHPQPFRRYHELQQEIKDIVDNQLDPHDRPQENYRTAYHRATVMERAPFLPPRKLCKETCCVETVAISLEQDEHQIINTRDGIELADLVLPQKRIPMEQFQPRIHQYFGRTLDFHILPCLVPGTIIAVQNHMDLTVGFFHEYRPFIKVPYLITISGSDGNSPELYEEYLADPLLIKWYATNPLWSNKKHKAFHANLYKFQPLNLGLSFDHPQERHLRPYLELNHYQNPFADKSRWDLDQHPLDFDEDIFVQWRLYPLRPFRERLFDTLCANAKPSWNTVSCTHKRIAVHQVFGQMSRYRFGISPPGFGYDCYRTYELLLLGVIPIIEERNPESHRMFEGLPVIHMPNIKEYNYTRQDFIDTIENYIASPAFQDSTFDQGWKRLFLQHQRQNVLKDTKRDREILVDPVTGKRYYQGYRYSLIGPGNNTQNKELRYVMRAKWFDDPQPKITPAEKDWLKQWQKLSGIPAETNE